MDNDIVGVMATNDLLIALNDYFDQFNKSNESFGLPMPDEKLRSMSEENELDSSAMEYFQSHIAL